MGDGSAGERRQQPAQLAAIVRDSLRQFGVVPVEIDSLQSANNATYRVLADDGRCFALRITSSYYAARQTEAELVWLTALQGQPGVRVPQPIATADGRYIIPIGGRTESGARASVLFNWITGERRGDAQLSAGDYRDLGAAIARLHRASAAFHVPPGFERPSWDLIRSQSAAVVSAHDRIGEWLPEADRGQFRELALACRRSMERLGREPRHYGIIHSDLHTGNYVFSPSGIAILDFDDMGWGYYAYDLATALFGPLERPDYVALREALVEGYTSLAPLPHGFREQVATFQVLRALFLTSLVWPRGNTAENDWCRRYISNRLTALLAGVRADAPLH